MVDSTVNTGKTDGWLSTGQYRQYWEDGRMVDSTVNTGKMDGWLLSTGQYRQYWEDGRMVDSTVNTGKMAEWLTVPSILGRADSLTQLSDRMQKIVIIGFPFHGYANL